MLSLAGKNIIVTGASSGIGRQCAINSSKLGAKVLLLGRDAERLAETLSLMENSSHHLFHSVDIIDFEAITSIVKEGVSTLGKFHGLVNAAGVSVTLPLRAMSLDKMEAVFKTNVFAAIHLTKLFCQPATKADEGGSVVFISSVMGELGEAGKSLYGMSKGALLAGSKSLAIEYASKNIRFNCISPGVVVTPLSMNSVYSQSSEAMEKIKSYHPMGLGTPEDVANGVTFLLSDSARWITGTNLIIDGGYSAR